MSQRPLRSVDDWMTIAAEARAEDPEVSPCIGVCVMDAASGFCSGCLRTVDEIACWSSADNATKRGIKAALTERRAQLKSEP